MELSRPTFQELTQRIHHLCGLVIGQDKSYLVRHRLEPVIRSHGLDGFEHLLQRLRMRAEVQLNEAIIEAITTKETSFFRDQGLFQAIQQHVLPSCVSLLRGSGAKRHRIRIWSAGSSTGQEAYSLAMLVRDFVEALDAPRGSAPGLPDGNPSRNAGSGVSREADQSRTIRDNHFSILASDISAEVLEAAQTGRYSRSEVSRGLTQNALRRHFSSDGTHWTVTEPVRRLVHFRRFNLLHSPAELGAFDLILCRNVMIYFDEPTRKKVCQALCKLLHNGGWLALGSAESPLGIQDRMEEIKVGRMMLYRKPQGTV